MNTPSTSVSPGLGGFLAFFLLAIALWLLMRNMNARLRRMSYREEAESSESQRPAQGSAEPAKPAEPGEEAARSTPATTDEDDEDEGDRKPPSQG